MNDSCTLPTAERPLREAEFDTLFRTSLRGLRRVSDTRIELLLDASAETVAKDLARRETECCSFFEFTFGRAGDGRLALDIRVPTPYAEVLAAFADRAIAAAGLPA